MGVFFLFFKWKMKEVIAYNFDFIVIVFAIIIYSVTGRMDDSTKVNGSMERHMGREKKCVRMDRYATMGNGKTISPFEIDCFSRRKRPYYIIIIIIISIL
jgi:hypothetical protein